MAATPTAESSGRAKRAPTVRAIEFLGRGSLRFAERALAPKRPLVAMEAAGICTTDRHIFAGRIPAPAPSVLGHELVGRLERGGEDLLGDSVRPGDRVLVAPGIACGRCERCRTGRLACVDRQVYGMTGLDGGFAPMLALAPGTRLYRVSEDLATAHAVLAEMTACIASGIRKAFGRPMPPPGADVAVLGFGPAGLCAASLVRWSGTRPLVVERDRRRAALAARLGFEVTASPEEPVDVVIECAGTPAAFATALAMLRSQGTLVELGNAADLGLASVSPSAICLGDLRVVGSAETLYEDFPIAIRAVAETPVDLAAAVSHVYPFDAIDDPNELFERPDGVFKAAIAFEPWRPQ